MSGLRYGLPLLVLLGCGEDPPAREPTCFDTGCPTGSSCFSFGEGEDVFAACLADDPADYRFAVRYAPRHGDAAAQWTDLQRFSEAFPDPADALSFVLPFDDSIVVVGSVVRRNPEDGREQLLPARIELRRNVPLPNRDPIVLSRSVADKNPSDGVFRITAPEGDYELAAWSVDRSSSFPPQRRLISAFAASVEKPTDGIPEVEIDPVEIPETIVLSGTVFANDGFPAHLVRVVALDALTGEAVSNAVLTGGQDVPEVEQGRFRLEVPATTGLILLRASESDANAVLARPTLVSPEVNVQGLTLDEQTGTYPLPSTLLQYSARHTVVLSGTVEGVSRAGVLTPVGGAILRFRSEDLGAPGLDDAKGSMDRLARVEADGTFVTQLPAGTYRVEMTPPSDPAFADLGVGIVTQYVNAAPEDPYQSGVVFEATQRVTLAGSVVDEDGSAVEGATVWLRGGGNLADRTIAAAENGVRSATARTSRDGAFLALVDGGHFDAIVQPPARARLPWSVQLGLIVTDDETLAEPFVVAPGRILKGIVLDEDAEPAPDVSIEVWCVTDEDAPVFPNRSVICGEATSNEEGEYEVLLPASLDVAAPSS